MNNIQAQIKVKSLGRNGVVRLAFTVTNEYRQSYMTDMMDINEALEFLQNNPYLTIRIVHH